MVPCPPDIAYDMYSIFPKLILNTSKWVDEHKISRLFAGLGAAALGDFETRPLLRRMLPYHIMNYLFTSRMGGLGHFEIKAA